MCDDSYRNSQVGCGTALRWWFPIGTFPTREEAQAVADSQELPHTVHKWEIHEYVNSTGCGWCDQEKVKGYRAPLGSALCAEHNSIRMETL